jgi:hypothetical protein
MIELTDKKFAPEVGWQLQADPFFLGLIYSNVKLAAIYGDARKF